MIKYLPILLAIYMPLTKLYGENETIEKRVEFTDHQFRQAVISLFHAERHKKESHFSRFDKSFIDDPYRIIFDQYWNTTNFNCFIIDRNKMKYEFNYMNHNWGYKIHGDIIIQDSKLQCKETKEIVFKHEYRK